MTVCGSGVSTAVTLTNAARPNGCSFFQTSSRVYCTSAAVKSLPSCHLTFLRSWKVVWSPLRRGVPRRRQRGHRLQIQVVGDQPFQHLAGNLPDIHGGDERRGQQRGFRGDRNIQHAAAHGEVRPGRRIRRRRAGQSRAGWMRPGNRGGSRGWASCDRKRKHSGGGARRERARAFETRPGGRGSARWPRSVRPVYSVRKMPRRWRIGTTPSTKVLSPSGSASGIRLKPSAAPPGGTSARCRRQSARACPR